MLHTTTSSMTPAAAQSALAASNTSSPQPQKSVIIPPHLGTRATEHPNTKPYDSPAPETEIRLPTSIGNRFGNSQAGTSGITRPRTSSCNFTIQTGIRDSVAERSYAAVSPGVRGHESQTATRPHSSHGLRQRPACFPPAPTFAFSCPFALTVDCLKVTP